MRDNITRLWGHFFALIFTATLLLVGANFYQLQPFLSAFILTIFAAIYLTAAVTSRRAFAVYPGVLLTVVAYNLLLYGLNILTIFLPLASIPLVLVFYLLVRQLPRRDLSFASDALDRSAFLVVLALALIIFIQVRTYASTAPVLASLTLFLLALYFVLRFAIENRTWYMWAFTGLAVPGFLFLLHSHTPQALYLASAVILLVAVWNLIRKVRVGESVLLIVASIYLAAATTVQWPETLTPLGYAAGTLALVSLSLSWLRRLQEVIPALAAALVLTIIPVVLTYPWSQYTALFAFLALTFFSYILSGSMLLRRERTMPGLIIGHSHVAFGEFLALVALTYAALRGFPLSYFNALTALLMTAVASLAGLQVSPIVVKFRRHFFYMAGLFLTFSFLTVLWHANPLGSTTANLSLAVLLLFLLYGVAEWSRSRMDQAVYTTMLEVPTIPAAIVGTLYILGKQPSFSTDLLVPIGLILPGILFYWRLKRPQMLAAPTVGLAVLILAVLMATGVSLTIAALVFLALGSGLVAWEIRSGVQGVSYVRLFALGVATLASIGLNFPWRAPTVFITAVWPVVYLIAASPLQVKERRVLRVGLETGGYMLMLLTMGLLVVNTLLLEATIIAAVYGLTFFVMTFRSRRGAYLYPATAFAVLAAFLVTLITGRGVWYVLFAFPLTAIFYAVGGTNLSLASTTPAPLPLQKSEDENGSQGEVRAPLYLGGHLNAAVGAIAFLLFTTKLDDATALVGVALHLVAYVWMAYRRQEREFLAGVVLSLCLLLLISLSFLPFVDGTNVLGYFIYTILFLLGYGWLLRRRGDTLGSQAVLSAVSVVTLISGGVALWADWLSPTSVWMVLVIGSLVWLGLLGLTRYDVFIYLITANLSLLGYSFLREVSDRFVNHVFIFLVYGCLLIALVFAYDLLSRRMKFRMPVHFGQKILRREWLVYGLPVLALAGVGIAGFGVESSSIPPFCNLCHTMNPYYDSWQISSHGQAGVSCVDCHYEPGAQSYVRNKIVGLSELVKTATNTEGFMPMAVVSDRSCLRSGCHTTTALKNTSVLLADRVSFAHGTHLERTLRRVDIHCTVCHAVTQVDQHLSIDEEACFLCHFKDRQDKPTAVGRCLDCHDAIRSQPTTDGFSHEDLLASQEALDCTICHQAVTFTDGGIKEVCSACHLQDSQELLRGETTKIHRLHVTDEGVRCSRCHDRIRHGERLPVIPEEGGTAALPTQAAAGTPPKLPLSHTGRTECLICHTTGAAGVPTVPMTTPNHTDFKDDHQASLCLSCHPPIAPPVTPTP